MNTKATNPLVQTHELSDSVDDLALKATSALTMLSFFFKGEKTEMPNDEIIFWTIRAAIDNIERISKEVNDFHEQGKPPVAGGGL